MRFTVTDDDTAAALGSGDLPVLGTPRLLAWCEAATLGLLDVPPGRTSVGTRVALEHLAPTAVGGIVDVTAEISYQDGRLVRFAVTATSGDTLVATGEITRVVVDAERFLGRLTS